MKKIELYGKSKDGKIEFDDSMAREKIAQFLGSKDGASVHLTMEEVKDPRSIGQLRFYWGVLLKAICNKTGHSSRMEMHEYLKAQFLMRHIQVDIEGEIKNVTVVPSLSKLNVAEMREYIEDVKELAIDIGVAIDHDEVDTYENLYADETMALFPEGEYSKGELSGDEI